MAKDKKGFILYADQKELFDQLPNEKAGELIKHIFSYVNDENPINKDLIINLAFTPIKQQLKRDLQKFEDVKVKRSEAGKKSAEAREKKRQQALTNPTSVEGVQQTSTNPTVKDNVTVTVNDNVTVKVNVTDTYLTCESFNDWFREKRESLGLLYNVKRLNPIDKQNFNELKDYTVKDFEIAFKNFSENKFWSNPKKNLLMPNHFLNHKHFVDFLNAPIKKELTLAEKLGGAIAWF